MSRRTCCASCSMNAEPPASSQDMPNPIATRQGETGIEPEHTATGIPILLMRTDAGTERGERQRAVAGRGGGEIPHPRFSVASLLFLFVPAMIVQNGTRLAS